eukprot:gnl/TRDRNA2_/TRDRNA2_176831_c0_seq16.p1 gnl/TRDRNA2_/TRDRNA2_176831_c0~~gnl/TRDRNA2_/TRDRNA2_176831_c0_seq16.p1  ORF type:complete len:358 (-),score=29.44 gnl/TRDRNA2_/TRDRNA2_176831_c0_seq16:94-1167(-)
MNLRFCPAAETFLMIAVLGRTYGLRLITGHTESDWCPQSRSAEGLPRLKKCDLILQTDAFWQHVDQKFNDTTSFLYCKGGINMSAIVQRINARFAAGTPNDDVNAAGVFVHAFDLQNERTYARFPEATWTHSIDEQHRILSASVINSRVPYLFIGNAWYKKSTKLGSAGFVIAPRAVAASLRCSYASDGETKHWNKNTVPGCIGIDRIGRVRKACEGVEPWTSNTTCSWPASRLKNMMLQHEQKLRKQCGQPWTCRCQPRNGVYPTCTSYNEVVLDPEKLAAHMPDAIEAIYFLTGTAARSHISKIPSKRQPFSGQGARLAKYAQTMFQQMYGKALPVMQVANLTNQAPFELCDEDR